MFGNDLATSVYVVPDSYSNLYTDEHFPSIKDIQSPDLVTIINGIKCLGIKDCCHIRTWHKGFNGEQVFSIGIAVAQVTPADGHMFLWDMRKHDKRNVSCKRCTQHLLRPVMNSDHKDLHAPQCPVKTLADGIRAPKRALTEIRLHAQFQRAYGSSVSQTEPVEDINSSQGVENTVMGRKQSTHPDLSRDALVALLHSVGGYHRYTRKLNHPSQDTGSEEMI
jgi:hypothetical protein